MRPVARVHAFAAKRGKHARAASAALLAALLFASSAYGADPRAELEKARASFLARNWSEAESFLRPLIENEANIPDRALVSRARMYLGAALLEEGRQTEAKQVFRDLALRDFSFDPDPLSFPSQAINLFIDVRASLQEEIHKAAEQNAANAAKQRAALEALAAAQREWQAKVEALARETEVTVRHSRLIACVPFGIGQFQNGQTALGIVFLGAEVAAIGGTVVTYAMYNYARGRERDEILGVNDRAAQWHKRASDLRLVNLGFVGGFLAAVGVGVAQAQIAFVPEKKEIRTRDIPPKPVSASLSPVIAPVAGGGAMVGVSGVIF
jgi:hypothetical protein